MLLNQQASKHHKATGGEVAFIWDLPCESSVRTTLKELSVIFQAVLSHKSISRFPHEEKGLCLRLVNNLLWRGFSTWLLSLMGEALPLRSNSLFFHYGMEIASLWAFPCSVGNVCNRIHNASIMKGLANMENSWSVNSTHLIKLPSKVTGSTLYVGKFSLASIGTYFLELQ